ncbi:PREDICTED: protein FAM63A isoform X1 [Chinchilla lanigera]|uniref:protein FAM63A isoform X1 n=1 Tax=Chinchilla lanigera TaxID=34839 RepID=UPI00038F0D45|nr:PREDICTED: protein FAM63A isoform X1 [Chinchilla lanigera]XP_005414530.1 PREDICTED: protein FAM63A isoform X1 [Chinchilla lanigera]XP_005414531.1 PREDICTED: protein FAM63A isoform X1 [Chinchilla lanigera]XP_005414534.1 PREDICTED: protein FAM63A isoform X1 [Chinchilla lanigera]XP_005414535.1 PREDICTED: protein FAM63A isoform X1 [Chinchilla lanigera]XP_013365366.1 PREDICTED: protein FAM63A isoform X1 [Chinchilla lanigera]
MAHVQSEHLGPDKARSAEAVTWENHEVPLGSEEQPQNADAEDGNGEREQGDQREPEPGDQTPLPAQGGENLECPPPEAHARPPGPACGKLPKTEAIGACSRPQELPQSPRARQPEPDFYCVKWIPWKGERTPVITQSANGPCPLLAIMNTLFLQWKVKLPPQKEVITSDELMAHLGDCLLSIKPQEKSEGLQLNFQQNVDDAMTVLPKLATGLDVNVRFTGVSDFEYTPECSVFDLLGIPLYHGWLVDPQSPEAVSAVGKLSYNQLVEKIITCKHSSDPNLVTEGLIAEQFLETTAAQLTYHGLCELTAAAKEDELSVFFRNNHFSTMTKHKSHLYLLVTDQGFLQEEQVVWESLQNVDGDSCFCDSDFHLSHALGKAPGAEGGDGSPEKQLQVDQDYLIALSLQQQQPQGTLGLTDLELAQQLQQEEYQQQQAVQPVQTRAPLPQGRGAASGRPAGERRPRPKHQSDCVLL